MVYIALSDLGRNFVSRQTNTSIRETIAQKTYEVSTGDASDIPAQAGEATQVAPLQTGAEMLSAIQSYLTALPAGADTAAALDAWFNDPALPDGFLNWGYQGTMEAGAQQIDQGQEISFNLQANHQVFRDLLHSYAAVVLSEEMGMSGEQQLKAIKASGMEALSLAEDFVGLQSRVGVLQSEVETAQTRLAAEKTALGLEERKIAQADSFEAATLLQSASDQLELHYTLTSKLSKLSLVNYL